MGCTPLLQQPPLRLRDARDRKAGGVALPCAAVVRGRDSAQRHLQQRWSNRPHLRAHPPRCRTWPGPHARSWLDAWQCLPGQRAAHNRPARETHRPGPRQPIAGLPRQGGQPRASLVRCARVLRARATVHGAVRRVLAWRNRAVLAQGCDPFPVRRARRPSPHPRRHCLCSRLAPARVQPWLPAGLCSLAGRGQERASRGLLAMGTLVPRRRQPRKRRQKHAQRVFRVEETLVRRDDGSGLPRHRGREWPRAAGGRCCGSAPGLREEDGCVGARRGAGAEPKLLGGPAVAASGRGADPRHALLCPPQTASLTARRKVGQQGYCVGGEVGQQSYYLWGALRIGPGTVFQSCSIRVWLSSSSSWSH
mmetsp:Transcript_17635/g.42766  ORF Transcript_17635/g.42766 Transcript_17635/m.42766 type:complete len:364 (+) Transcript_17635:9813-10904(+)